MLNKTKATKKGPCVKLSSNYHTLKASVLPAFPSSSKVLPPCLECTPSFTALLSCTYIGLFLYVAPPRCSGGEAAPTAAAAAWRPERKMAAARPLTTTTTMTGSTTPCTCGAEAPPGGHFRPPHCCLLFLIKNDSTYKNLCAVYELFVISP